MANRAYISAWAEDYSEATQRERFQRLLATVPLSASWPGFDGILARAVDPAESPLFEWDLRGQPMGAAEVVDLIQEVQGSDVAYEVRARWDLWVFDLDAGNMQHQPQPLEIHCYGPDFDGGIAAEQGHFQMDVGFEHLFTGHAGLLGNQGVTKQPAEHPVEERFLAAMAAPERLREYHEKTRENIQQLFRWMRQADLAVPLNRYRLWSEGEENFEARVDEILAVR
jgi:hypothetical protein